MKEGYSKPDNLNAADTDDGDFSEVTDLSETSLKDLASSINQVQLTINGKMGGLLTLAAEAGVLLINAKAQVKHGEWLGWIAKNVKISRSQVARYMVLGANPELLSNVARKLHLPSIETAATAINNELKGDNPKPKKDLSNFEIFQKHIAKAMRGIDVLTDLEEQDVLQQLKERAAVEEPQTKPVLPAPAGSVESVYDNIDTLTDEEKLDLVRYVEEKVGGDAIVKALSVEASEQAPAKPETTMTDYINRIEKMIPPGGWKRINRRSPAGLPTPPFLILTQAKATVEAALEGLLKKEQKPVIRAVLRVLDYFDTIQGRLVNDAIQAEKQQIANDPHNTNFALLSMISEINSKDLTRALFRIVAKEVHPDKGGDPETSKRLGKIKAQAKKGGLL